MQGIQGSSYKVTKPEEQQLQGKLVGILRDIPTEGDIKLADIVRVVEGINDQSKVVLERLYEKISYRNLTLIGRYNFCFISANFETGMEKQYEIAIIGLSMKLGKQNEFREKGKNLFFEEVQGAEIKSRTELTKKLNEARFLGLEHDVFENGGTELLEVILEQKLEAYVLEQSEDDSGVSEEAYNELKSLVEGCYPSPMVIPAEINRRLEAMAKQVGVAETKAEAEAEIDAKVETKAVDDVEIIPTAPSSVCNF